jgi:hypothetical protein
VGSNLLECAETNENFLKNIKGNETLVMAVKLSSNHYNEYLIPCHNQNKHAKAKPKRF